MTNAPERIWASEAKAGYGDWQLTSDGMYRPVEYIRADLVDAQDAAWSERVAALEAAIRAAAEASK